MWSILQTKSDAEPWWFLEGWRQDIINEWTFQGKIEAFQFFQQKIEKLISEYEHFRVKRGTQIAFWNEGEFLFCESCDEDLQLYHGFLILLNNEPFTKAQMSNEEKEFFDQIIQEDKKKTEA